MSGQARLERRAAFLAGEGTLTAQEVQEWTVELAPQRGLPTLPAGMLATEPLVVSVVPIPDRRGLNRRDDRGGCPVSDQCPCGRSPDPGILPGGGCRCQNLEDLVHVDQAFSAEAKSAFLIAEFEDYLLWEPGRKGHAAAHKRLVEAVRVAKAS